MGIADGIDRLLRTLRPPAAAPPPRAGDSTAGLPATTSGNGRDPVPAEREPVAPTADRPSGEPAPEAPVTPSFDTLTGALTARVEEAYQSHREAVVTEEPAEATALLAYDDADALPTTEPEHPLVETPEVVDQVPAEPTSVGEPPVSDERPDPARGAVVLPPVIEEADAIGSEVVLGRERPAPPATRAALHADSLARLEAASGIAESLGLGFHLGGAVERIAYGASQGRDGVDALREATWLIERYVALVEQRPVGADLHASAVRLGRSGDAIAEIRALTAALDASRDTRLAALGAASNPSSAGALPGPIASELTPDGADATPSAPPTPEPERERESFSHEVALMAVRWGIMVIAVIAVVLAVTLIGEWV